MGSMNGKKGNGMNPDEATHSDEIGISLGISSVCMRMCCLSTKELANDL